MKKIGILFLCLISLSGFANDGGLVQIDVKGINPENGKTGSEYVIAANRTRFSFDSDAALNMFKRLPKSGVVSETDKYEYRYLRLKSAKWSLLIGCDLDRTIAEELQKHAVECSINLSSDADSGDEGDLVKLKNLEFTVPAEVKNKTKVFTNSLNNSSVVDPEIPVEAVIAKEGTKITAYGKDIEEFLRLLPDSKKLLIKESSQEGREADQQLEISCIKAKDSADSSCSFEYTIVEN